MAGRAVSEKITKGRAGTRWGSVVEKVGKDIGGNQGGLMSAGKFGRYKAEVEVILERKGRLAKNKTRWNRKNSWVCTWGLGIYLGLREENMKTCLHGPTDFAQTPKLRFRVRDLDLPEKRKRCTCSLEEEEVDAQMCPCGNAIESSTHMGGQCEMYY